MAIHILKKQALVLLLSALPVLCQVSRAPIETPGVASPGGPALPDRKIAPSDLLSIQVYDEPEVSRPSVRVGGDGTLVIPGLPKPLMIAGLLPREVETEVKQALIDAELLVHPTVLVTILDYAYRQISVSGSVKTPSQFNITQPISLFEALAKAGGLAPEAGSEVLVSKSPTEPSLHINLIQLQNNPDPSTNIMLNGGELVSVPEAPKLFVTGNVTRPGPVPIRIPGDATVLKVVASVGGLTQYYNKTAYIYRADATGKRQEIEVPLRKIMLRKAQDVNLAIDDILLVPDDNGTKRRALLSTLQGMAGSATSASIIFGLQHP